MGSLVRRRSWLALVLGSGVAVAACGEASLGEAPPADAAPAPTTSPIEAEAGPDAARADAADANVPPDASPDAADAAVPCVPPEAPRPEDAARVAAAWQRLEPKLTSAVVTTLAAGQSSYVLYDTQLQTANLLLHAEYARDVAQLEGLARVYEPAFDALVPRTEAFYYYAVPAGGGAPVRESVWTLPTPTRMWTDAAPAGLSVGPESVLVSSQFLYAASRLVRVITEMPSPPAALTRFAAKALPVIVDDHYRRWIDKAPGLPGSFQVRGWGCNTGTYSHREHLQNLQARSYGTAALPSPPATPAGYCNTMTDTDLWLIAGTLEILAAHRRSPARVPLPASVVASFESYVALGLTVVKGRIGTTTLDSPAGPVQGMVFDPGGFDGHPDMNYVGYTDTSPACRTCTAVGQCTCPEFPGWTTATPSTPRLPPQPVSGVAWDISHARRLVSVFDSFRRHRAVVPAVAFTDVEAKAFARQVAFGVWNGDLASPQFATFFDGRNGWYRVNYSSRSAFGYPPGSMTSSAPLCGYGFWAELEPALRPALDAAFAKIDTPPDTTDGQALKVIQGLPEHMPYRVEPNACGF